MTPIPNNDDPEAVPFKPPKRYKIHHDSSEHEQQVRMNRRENGDYTIGWICALPIEMAAALAMLDCTHESLPIEARDTNAYKLGHIGPHNIVIACLGDYGTINAAHVAANMERSFPAIRAYLMVGIGGGAPGSVDLRLGDVVVGRRVMQYEMGKVVGDGLLERPTVLSAPRSALSTAVSKLRAVHESNPTRIPFIVEEMLARHPKMTKYAYPTGYPDRLFVASYQHNPTFSSCEACDASQLVQRAPRPNQDPKIYYGAIASGNKVMKHGITRDKIAQELDVICFEMEAAGLTDHLPNLVVRGICDYSDSHKNKKWQEYAAAAAAAYTKELLLEVSWTQAKTYPTVESGTLDAMIHMHTLLRGGLIFN
jgi:nucleoside phosphorylase